MARGKYQKTRRGKLSKGATMLLAVALVLTFAAGGTLAYLAVSGGTVTNTFQAAQVSCQVNTDGTVKNTSNVDAYIRATATVNWMDGSGNVYAKNVDFNINEGNGWTKGSDGFFYHDRVTPGNTTGVLDVTFTQGEAPATGYKATVVIVAEALQADGIADSAVEAWSNAPGNG